TDRGVAVSPGRTPRRTGSSPSVFRLLFLFSLTPVQMGQRQPQATLKTTVRLFALQALLRLPFAYRPAANRPRERPSLNRVLQRRRQPWREDGIGGSAPRTARGTGPGPASGSPGGAPSRSSNNWKTGRCPVFTTAPSRRSTSPTCATTRT